MASSASKVKFYIGLTSGIAFFLAAHYLPQFHLELKHLPGFLVFALSNMFSEYLAVTMPFIGMISVTYAIDLAIIIVFGVPAGIIIALIGYLGACLLKYKSEKILLSKFVFNLSLFIITIASGGFVYQAVLKFLESENIFLINAVLAGAMAYYLVNATLLAFLFAFLENKSVFGIWVVNMRWAVPNLLALAPIGYILAYIYINIGIIGVLTFFLPMLLARHSFKQYMDVREMYLKTIKSLAATIDAKDHYTAGHSERVARYVVAICEEMGLQDDYIENLKDLALLHDIGKISIPEHILNKPGRLEDWEMEKMKTHALSSFEIVKLVTILKDQTVVKSHHERIDGKGYPDGLKGNEIPLGARIIAVADSFDAMTTDRPYRKGMDISSALKELERCRGTQFDPRVIDAFVGSLLKNEDGRLTKGRQRELEG